MATDKKPRNISEKTLLTVLVNLKCLGKPGRCLRAFTMKERDKIFDTLEERGWITPDNRLTPSGAEQAKHNLHLIQD